MMTKNHFKDLAYIVVIPAVRNWLHYYHPLLQPSDLGSPHSGKHSRGREGRGWEGIGGRVE